jgi:hypothetical protein
MSDYKVDLVMDILEAHGFRVPQEAAQEIVNDVRSAIEAEREAGLDRTAGEFVARVDRDRDVGAVIRDKRSADAEISRLKGIIADQDRTIRNLQDTCYELRGGR